MKWLDSQGAKVACLVAMAVILVYTVYSGIARDRWPIALAILLLGAGITFLASAQRRQA